MKTFILSLKSQNDLSKNTLYQCTEPRPAKPVNGEQLWFVDTVTNKDQFSGIKVDNAIVLFVNVTPEVEAVLKQHFKFRESDLYSLL